MQVVFLCTFQIFIKPKLSEPIFSEVFIGSSYTSGCIYIHPSLPMEEFNTLYLASLLHRANIEGKSIFLLVEFNQS